MISSSCAGCGTEEEKADGFFLLEEGIWVCLSCFDEDDPYWWSADAHR